MDPKQASSAQDDKLARDLALLGLGPGLIYSGFRVKEPRRTLRQGSAWSSKVAHPGIKCPTWILIEISILYIAIPK